MFAIELSPSCLLVPGAPFLLAKLQMTYPLAQRGQWRDCADVYRAVHMAACATGYTHFFACYALSGWVSILCDEQAMTTEADRVALRAIVGDGLGPVPPSTIAEWATATFSLGFLEWLVGRRAEAVRLYRLVIAFKPTTMQRAANVLNGRSQEVEAGIEFDKYVRNARQNAAKVTRDESYVAGLGPEPPNPVFPPNVPVSGRGLEAVRRTICYYSTSELGSEEGDRLIVASMRIGGAKCDYCLKSRSECPLLTPCSTCGGKWYCTHNDDQCREADLIAHRPFCRPPRDVRRGDIVVLEGLIARPECNGEVMQVRQTLPNDRIKVGQITRPGNNPGPHPTMSVHADKMRRVLCAGELDAVLRGANRP